MTITRISLKERMLRLFYFFPLQLVILHIKKNHLLLLFWVVLFGYVCGGLGEKYGVPILFLYPEYLGNNNHFAFGLLGFATGGFIMAFNLYSYIMHGFRFPFIASLARPFLKFSVNNFIVPLSFIVTYCIYSYDYQITKELVSSKDASINLVGFIVGIFLFCLLAFAYFLSTNKDVFRFIKAKKGLSEGFGLIKKKDSLDKESKRWQNLRANRRTWRVETYLQHPFRIGLARDSIHYNNEIIAKILSQNHINASIFEILVILSFLIIGSLREFGFFMIPAAASFFLLFTMALMIISALYSWFKGWTISVLVIAVIIVNSFSGASSILNKESRAYGLNYEVEPANYTNYVLKDLPTPDQRKTDLQHTIRILNNWKKKIRKKHGISRPKLILLNCSGGGLRSALWNFKVLRHLDSLSQGQFYDHVALITGSSGGMIGQAVYRELKLEEFYGKKINYKSYYKALGKDILNPIAFSLVTNDLFIRYQKTKDNGFSYTKDRGYAFEHGFNNNTNFVLDKRMSAYQEPEASAQIPMMILSPSVVNDARKLLISSNPISFLTTQPNKNSRPLAENISFSDLLKDHQPEDLKVTTALRMSSTFPFILPSITLPTVPKLDLLDAGFRDNYGLTTSIAYASQLHDWIRSNTSGVIFVQIRDVQKYGSVSSNINATFLNKLISPLETVYGNIFNIHNYTQDQIWSEFVKGCDYPIETQIITLQKDRKDKISLSWHLSKKEKKYIANGFSEDNPHPEIGYILSEIKK